MVESNSPIYVDDRVGAKDLEDYLGILCEVTRLEFGDVAFMGKGPDGAISVGIERKTLGDYIASHRNGRLAAHQLPGMLKSYSVCYLLIEGVWKADESGDLLVPAGSSWRVAQGGVRYAEFVKSLNTLELICNIKILYSRSAKNTAQLVQALYGWWQEDWEDHRSHLRFQEMPGLMMTLDMEPPSLARRLYKELPGIGWNKSQSLERRFPKPHELIKASQKEIAEVEGIGKILSKQIFELLHGPVAAKEQRVMHIETLYVR